jgi:hypothetical protein
MSYSWRFLGLVGVFVTTLVVSNIVAVKLVEVSDRVFDAGNILFPLAYLIGDVLTEVYGFRAARRVIWLGFACWRTTSSRFSPSITGICPSRSRAEIPALSPGRIPVLSGHMADEKGRNRVDAGLDVRLEEVAEPLQDLLVERFRLRHEIGPVAERARDVAAVSRENGELFPNHVGS